MSQTNLDVVRSVWRAYASDGMDAALEYFSEDCVCEDFPDLPDRSTYIGREGVAEWYEGFARIWGELEIKPTELIELEGGAVLSVGTIRGRGKGSSAPVDVEAAWVCEFRGGLIARARAFRSRDDALMAARASG